MALGEYDVRRAGQVKPQIGVPLDQPSRLSYSAQVRSAVLPSDKRSE